MCVSPFHKFRFFFLLRLFVQSAQKIILIYHDGFCMNSGLTTGDVVVGGGGATRYVRGAHIISSINGDCSCE